MLASNRPKALLDFKALLQPIVGADPAGRWLRFDGAMRQLEAWRKESEIPSTMLKEGEKPQTAEWKQIIESARDLLETQSKDLEIVAALTEALGRVHKLPGLRDGLRLFLGVHVLYWPSYYPRLKGADLTPRHKPFAKLDTDIPIILREIPLATGPGAERFTLAKLKVDANKAPDASDAPSGGAGDRGPATFKEAIQHTPTDYYLDLHRDVIACMRVLRHIKWSNHKTKDGTDRRLSARPRPLSEIAKVLDLLKSELESALEDKGIDLKPRPDPDTEPDDEAPSAKTQEPDDRDAAEAGNADSRRSTTPRPRSSDAAIDDAEEARRRIAEAAAFLRDHAPQSADGLLAARALLIGRLLDTRSVPHPLRLSEVKNSPPLERALGSLQRKDVEGAVPFLRDALNAATTERERFQINLYLAETLLALSQREMARFLAEDLVKLIDQYKLEQWEDRRLSARVWAVLLGCLKPEKGEEPGSDYQEAYARLCRLDIHIAYRIANDPD